MTLDSIEKMNGVIRTPFDMDFAGSAIDHACEIMAKRDDSPIVAICSQSAAIYPDVHDAARRAGISLIVPPDNIMAVDGWAVVGKRTTVWSPGA